MNRFDEAGVGKPDKLFRQQGRKVFKEVCPMAAEMIKDTVTARRPDRSTQVSRYWLHQANLNMNLLIARMLLGRDAEPRRSAGDSRHLRQHLVGRFDHRLPQVPGRSCRQARNGVICSFGAGYSIGCVVVRKK